MIYNKETVLKYRVSRALETLEEAKILAINNHWNSMANRLYYSSFYIVIALLFSNDIRTKTHAGARTSFSSEFIKTGKLSKELGVFYGNLFNKRQVGDYDDIKRFTKDEIEPLIKETENFVSKIIAIIKINK